MAIDFPNSPAPGTNHTVDGKTWTFTDGKWALNVGVGGVQGPAGVAIQGTAPATTDVLWADTSDTGLVIVPAGGTTGQVLAKSSGSDYATAWATPVTSGDMALKADLASPTFTGTPTLPTGTIATTQTAGNSSTAIATTAFVGTAVANLVDSAPATLNTLDELALALGDDANFATTTATAIGLKAPLASPTFTGTVTIPSGASISGFAPLASPTFTGTPTLPTGTIATTQSAGNNTTAVATTAFVTTAVVNAAPQTTVYTSGSGTYTVPSGARWLSVKMVGGGGGGAVGASGGNATTNGAIGTATTFGTGIASAGAGGLVNDNGGIGTASTMISGGVGVALAGGDGGPSAAPYGTGRAANEGGQGGSSAFGGAGAGRGGSNEASGGDGKPNTGGGGGAAGGSNAPGTYAGGGGASGGYVECVIASPAATYSYAVGAGGAGGNNGSRVGGNGGSGVIYVVAYF